MMRRLLNRVLGDLETFAFYWRVAITPNPKEATVLLSLIVGSAVLDAVSVGLTIPLLDILTNPDRAHHDQIIAVAHRALQAMGIMPTANLVSFTLMLTASAVFLAKTILTLLSLHWTSAIAARLRAAMKVSLFEKFLYARYEEITKRARGGVVYDINGPPEALAASIVNLVVFFTGLFNSLLMMALLLYLSWWATVLLGILAMGGVQGWRWYADRRAATHGRLLYTLRGEQSKLQVDAIDGLKVVKAHGLERQIVNRQAGLLDAELDSELRLVLYRNGPTVVNEVMAIAVILALGAITFLCPSLGIRFSTLTAFLLAMRRIAPATANVNTASVILHQHRQSLEMIDEVMTRLPQEPRGGERLDPQINEIQFADVSFAYASRPDHQVLRGITATVRRGTVTALVGPTGSGKSTIANLLMGLYEPLSGAIAINGVDLRRIDLKAWRAKVGYVSQDIFVFNATIADNMILGDERISRSQIEWAARVAQLHEFVSSFPQGYQTVIGDRGLRLSGGQCQRLAIARAILRRPEVLIFDEATSALDNLTERAVYDAISSLQREAVVIVIAHRLSTVREADQILVVQAGRVVESGTHEALISHHGTYAALYEEDAQTQHAAAAAGAVVSSGSETV